MKNLLVIVIVVAGAVAYFWTLERQRGELSEKLKAQEAQSTYYAEKVIMYEIQLNMINSGVAPADAEKQTQELFKQYLAETKGITNPKLTPEFIKTHTAKGESWFAAPPDTSPRNQK